MTPDEAYSIDVSSHSGAFGALLRIPIPYLLEVYESGSLSYVMTLPQSPQKYEQRRPSATVITHTLNEVVRELTENHLTEIVLSGVSGRADRLGNTRTGRASVLNGREIMEEFDLFLDRYQKRAAGSDSYMVFRALDEGQAYRVEPMDWKWSEDAARSRFSYQWVLRLEAYAHAHARSDLSVFPTLSAGLKKVSDKLTRTSTNIALAGLFIQNAGSVVTELMFPFSDASRLLTSIQKAVSSSDGIRTYLPESLPLRLISTMKNLRNTALRVEELLELDTSPSWSNKEDSLRRSISRSTSVTYEGTTMAGLLGVRGFDDDDALAPTVTDTDVVVQIVRQLVRYRVRAGDTLQSIALRVYGDISRWVEIAEANNMRGARYLSDGRTLSVGDVILVPRGTSLNAPATSVYGTDFKLSDDGDLVFTDDGDLATVTGVKNLEQAIRNRLLTTLGACWIMPEYGLPLRLGTAITAEAIAHAASHVRDQLERENRIDTVQRVQIIQEGDKLAVELDLLPIEGGSTTIITPYLGS